MEQCPPGVIESKISDHYPIFLAKKKKGKGRVKRKLPVGVLKILI